MTAAPDRPTAGDLVAHAHDTRVVVIGGGVAGLVAALECARIGMSVTVVEAAAVLGGTVVSADDDGVRLDLVADSFASAAPELSALIDDLGLRDAVEPAAADQVWIAGLRSSAVAGSSRTGAAPLPSASLLGIPANPWADDVRRFIGWRGAWRAYLDRLRPPLTIGHQRSLGALVRSRMGERIADRMVAPLTVGGYGLNPDDVDVAAVLPGLNTALTRTGSLAGAVGQLLPESGSESGREAGAASGTTAGIVARRRATLRGGMTGLIDALAERLRDLGVDVRTGVRAERIEAATPSSAAPSSAEASAWRVVTAESIPTPDTEAGAVPGTDTETGGVAGSAVAADLVIVATPEPAARRLLDPVLRAAALPAPEAGDPVDVVTLLLASPALDARPRGTAVYPVPGTATARSVSHVTAAWPWLAEGLGAGLHVVRVVLPATPDGDRADADAAVLARTQAEALLGVPLPADALRAAHRVTVTPAPPASRRGHADRTAAVRRAVATAPGIAVVGGWVAGSGIAAVVADAVAESERARSAALWGGGQGAA